MTSVVSTQSEVAVKKKEETFAPTVVVAEGLSATASDVEAAGSPKVFEAGIQTEGAVQRFDTESFSAEEERVLRMRYGVTLEPGAVLGSKLDSLDPRHLEEVQAKLILIEAQVRAYVAESQDARKQHIIDALKSKD